MATKLEDLSIEELIRKAAYWEDPDQTLQVHCAGQTIEEGIVIADLEWQRPVTKPTFKEALIEYIKGSQKEKICNEV